METNTKPYPLSIMRGMQSRVKMNPDYQRGSVWKENQKQLLMDTILRNYDIPKFYWHKVKRDDGVEYEVVDGQQRLNAILGFCNDEYRLAKNMDVINGVDLSSCLYSKLPFEVFEKFNLYVLDIVIITDAHDEEVRNMFLRLQNGTTLKPQEKRNAMVGEMRDVVKDIAEHPFFESCFFKNTRFSFDLIAAQTILLELKGGATNIKNADLNNMYETYSKFDDKEKIVQKVKRVYDFLLKAFPENNGHLKYYNVVNLYCIASLLIDHYVWQDLDKPLADWFVSFEMERHENDEREEADRDIPLLEYSSFTKSSSDTKDYIQKRLKMLEERFFLACPDIAKRDSVRSFSQEQRLAIYWRDGGRCQLIKKCDGKNKLGWNDWHADHKIPHSQGGATIVSNGQVACPACNLSKGNNG